jgi:hypothetical protein
MSFYDARIDVEVDQTIHGMPCASFNAIVERKAEILVDLHDACDYERTSPDPISITVDLETCTISLYRRSCTGWNEARNDWDYEYELICATQM